MDKILQSLYLTVQFAENSPPPVLLKLQLLNRYFHEFVRNNPIWVKEYQERWWGTRELCSGGAGCFIERYRKDTGMADSLYDLPAITWDDGSLCWLKNGEEHREGDLPAIINLEVGYEVWYKHGKA